MAAKDLIRMTEGALDNMIVEAVNYAKIGGTQFQSRCSSAIMVETFNDLVWRRKAPKEITLSRVEHWLGTTECAFIFVTGYSHPTRVKLTSRGYGVFKISGVQPRGAEAATPAEGFMVLNVINDQDFYQNCCAITQELGHDSLYHKPLDSEMGYLVSISDDQHGNPDTFIHDVFIDYLTHIHQVSVDPQQSHRDQPSYQGILKINPYESIRFHHYYSRLARQSILPSPNK